jgi:hypothetical protein
MCSKNLQPIFYISFSTDLIILSCNKKTQTALNNKLHIIESDDNFGILINVYS